MSLALRCICCLLLACLFPASYAFAADMDAILKKTQAAYAAMQTFSADFTQVLVQRETGTSEKRRGSILFKKPLFVRWETAAPNAELLLVNDKEIWNYLPDEELAYRYSRSLAEDSRSIIQVVTGLSPLDRDFDVQEIDREEGGELLHLVLCPKEPSTEMTEAQLWIDASSGLIRRVRIMDFYGNTNEIELEKLKSGASVSDADFRFTPPEGVEVEDHLEKPHPLKTPLTQ